MLFSTYIGLVPGFYNSSDSEKYLGITPRSRSQHRSYFIEAAWVAIIKILRCNNMIANIKEKM